jgi:hypothetical protein
MTRLTEPGTTPGTPGYMAPEQVSGGELDARSDLFAFGVLAWELATGEHPFGSNPAIVLARMMEGRPASGGRQLPMAGLDPIVKRCLRAAPDDRYPSADVLLEDLRRLRTPSDVQRAITGPAETAGSGLWWWQFHQGMMIAVDASTPLLAWLSRPVLNPSFRTQFFLAVLALATAAVTLRLNLLFTARVHRSTLAGHYAKLFRWIAGAEFGIAILLLASAAYLADAHPGTAALLVSLAIVMLASFSLIEPATSGGAGLRD